MSDYHPRQQVYVGVGVNVRNTCSEIEYLLNFAIQHPGCGYLNKLQDFACLPYPDDLSITK
jgi:hypothetical protein